MDIKKRRKEEAIVYVNWLLSDPFFPNPSSQLSINQYFPLAQGNSTCTNTNGFEINSQDDLKALGFCSIITGNILIQSVAIDTVTIPDSVQYVNGDIRVGQISSLTSFRASGLKNISGTFELLNLTGLQTLTAPNLATVGTINFIILPKLGTMTLGITKAKNVRISDTELTSLSGFSLASVGDFQIGIPSPSSHNSSFT